MTVDPVSKPIGVPTEDWEKLDRKARSTIHLCLSDLVLLNVSGEDSVKKLWEKLGNLYQSKSLVKIVSAKETVSSQDGRW